MAPDEIIDRLYGLPLSEFTAARNEAARDLRKTGQREAAELVKALRKPTAAAGAVNRLVREHRDEVEQFLRAAAELRDAQFSGKGDLAAATRLEHEALERLTARGGEEVRQSLLAASVDDEAAGRLLDARLERELEPAGFGTLLAHVTPTGARLAPTTAKRPGIASAQAEQGRSAARLGPARRKEPGPSEKEEPARETPNETALRARLRDARAALEAAEAQERQARHHWDETRREAERARKVVEGAQRDLDRHHPD
jgi:hypothetical protein